MQYLQDADNPNIFRALNRQVKDIEIIGYNLCLLRYRNGDKFNCKSYRYCESEVYLENVTEHYK